MSDKVRVRFPNGSEHTVSTDFLRSIEPHLKDDAKEGIVVIREEPLKHFLEHGKTGEASVGTVRFRTLTENRQKLYGYVLERLERYLSNPSPTDASETLVTVSKMQELLLGRKVDAKNEKPLYDKVFNVWRYLKRWLADCGIEFESIGKVNSSTVYRPILKIPREEALERLRRLKRSLGVEASTHSPMMSLGVGDPHGGEQSEPY